MEVPVASSIAVMPSDLPTNKDSGVNEQFKRLFTRCQHVRYIETEEQPRTEVMRKEWGGW